MAAGGVQQQQQVSTVMLLLLFSSSGGTALEMVTVHPPACSLRDFKGLTNCSLTPVASFARLHPDHAATVRSVELKAILCCSDKQECEPCLQILITIQGIKEKELPEVSGEQMDEDESSGSKQLSGPHVLRNPAALDVVRLKVCVSTPGSFEYCEAVHFTPTRAVQDHQPTPEMQLSLIEKVSFGSHVLVQVKAHKTTTWQLIDIPSLQHVCLLNLDGNVKQCDAPRLRAVTDHQGGVVRLQLEADTIKEEVMCRMFWDGMRGKAVKWRKDEREIIIPANSVAPCLCFQVSWKGKDIRRESCPFKNQQDVYERMLHNISLSMEEAPSRNDGRVLSWSMTAPCKLEAELWLCKRDTPWRCDEVMGSRQKLQQNNYSYMPEGRGLFQMRGEFINMTTHPSLCLQIQINGMNSVLEPHCPFAKPRWRWSVPLLFGLLIICLTVLGAYVMQGLLKGYVWGLLKGDNAKGAVGGGHVVLLYPPDEDNLQALPALTGRLGSSLQTLGFSVSLDMWSKAELGVLGPVPWLHSRLDRIQRQGGKVVLVLTQAAWVKAVAWGKWGWDRDLPRGGGGGVPAPCSDVFSATFSCILADFLQGRAGERFVLVQFEALPSQPAGCSLPLPELFRGLHLFSLPSQSLAFLTELDVLRGRGGQRGGAEKESRGSQGSIPRSGTWTERARNGTDGVTSHSPLPGLCWGGSREVFGNSASSTPSYSPFPWSRLLFQSQWSGVGLRATEGGRRCSPSGTGQLEAPNPY